MIDGATTEILSRLFKLLNEANRLRIISIIGKDKKSVSEIIEGTGLSQTLVSFHLRPLRLSGILSTERKGAFIYYSLAEPDLIDILKSLGGVKLKEDNKDEEQGIVFPPMRFMSQWMGANKQNKEE